MSDNQNNNYQKLDETLFRKYCKDYKYFPMILPARKPGEPIIAIGDLHGDYAMTVKALKLAGVIDDNVKWIGGNTFVVQVGDQVDNCRPAEHSCEVPSDIDSSYSGEEAEDIFVLKFMTELNEQAIKVGGRVISLLGNHEIMNVMGNMTYVSYNDVQKFKNYQDPDKKGKKFSTAKEARMHAFKPGNEYAKMLACTRLSAVIIGSYIFVHAGFINEFLNKVGISNKYDLYKISYLMKKWLLGLVTKNNVVDIINSRSYSMFWDRVLGSIPPNMNIKDDSRCVEYLNKALDIFDVGTMVIGHTPQIFAHHSGINKTCDGKLWRVDFGGSFGFNKFDPSYLKNRKIADYRKVQVLYIPDDVSEPSIIS